MKTTDPSYAQDETTEPHITEVENFANLNQTN